MKKTITGTTLGLLLLTGTNALANAQCATREDLTERLKVNYQEELAARGLQQRFQGATVLEIWASEKTGTFTVLMTNAHGQSCIMASGTHWYPQDADKLRGAVPGIPG